MRGDAQLVLVDLPGVQRPRDALTQRMQSRVERELADADAALLRAQRRAGRRPRRPLHRRRARGAPTCRSSIAVNKIDRLDRAHTLAVLQAAAELEVSDDIFPISARKGTGVEALVEHLVGLLPEGPFLFDADDALRPAASRAARRAHPRADPAAHLPGGAARRRGRRRGHRRTRATTSIRVTRARVGRGRVPEGHPDRRAGPDDQGDRHRRAARARAPPRRPRSTSTCRSACAAAGARDDALLDRLGIE